MAHPGCWWEPQGHSQTGDILWVCVWVGPKSLPETPWMETWHVAPPGTAWISSRSERIQKFWASRTCCTTNNNKTTPLVSSICPAKSEKLLVLLHQWLCLFQEHLESAWELQSPLSSPHMLLATEPAGTSIARATLTCKAQLWNPAIRTESLSKIRSLSHAFKSSPC